MLHEVFYWLLSMSIVATLTGGIVWVIRSANRLPRRVAVLFWLIPFMRMAVPLGVNSPYGVMALLSRLTTKTVTVFQPTEQVALSTTNCIMAADSYFPIRYKVELLETVFTIAAVVWLVGMLVLFAWMAVVYHTTLRRIKAAILLRDNVYRSAACKTPAVYGVFKPKIILPEAVNEDDFELIVLHERTHIRRGDNVWRLLAIAVTAVHWFNPFAWQMLKRYLADVETACDEQVTAQLGEERVTEYARMLLSFTKSGSPFVSALGGAGVKERIGRILSYKKLTWFSAAMSALLFAVSVFALLTNAG